MISSGRESPWHEASGRPGRNTTTGHSARRPSVPNPATRRRGAVRRRPAAAAQTSTPPRATTPTAPRARPSGRARRQHEDAEAGQQTEHMVRLGDPDVQPDGRGQRPRRRPPERDGTGARGAAERRWRPSRRRGRPRQPDRGCRRAGRRSTSRSAAPAERRASGGQRRPSGPRRNVEQGAAHRPLQRATSVATSDGSPRRPSRGTRAAGHRSGRRCRCSGRCAGARPPARRRPGGPPTRRTASGGRA